MNISSIFHTSDMKDRRKFSAKEAAVEELNDDIEVLYDSYISGAEPGNVERANPVMNKPNQKKVDTRVKGDKGNYESCCWGISVILGIRQWIWFLYPFRIFNYYFLECSSELIGRTDVVAIEDSMANSGSDANITAFQREETLEYTEDTSQEQG